MNILFFYQYFGTPKGSWSTRVYELTRRWVAAGHKVTVVTSPYDKSDIKASKFVERQHFDGIDLIVINAGDSNRFSTLKRAWRAVLFSLTAVWFALTLKADLVIASSGPITIGIPGLMAKWFRGRKLVFEIRDLWPQGGIELNKITNPLMIKVALWFERLCYKNSKLVVACSPGMEASVNQRFPEIKTLVIPNASDPSLFGKVQNVEFEVPQHIKGKKIFIYAGSLGLMDDCLQIIEGLAVLRRDDVHFVFLGDGAEREELEKRVAHHKLENVDFMGLIPKMEVVKWFSVAQASVVVFKNYEVLHTSSPNKMFDSFAAGVPIIQSTQGWIKDLVAQEKCGINVHPEKPEDMAQAFAILADNIPEREEMAKNALRLAQSTFNRDILAEKYLHALKSL